MADAAPPLCVEQCITIRPTMEEFRDEQRFLASDVVQAAGKKCGIVRVVPPDEFQPTHDTYTDAEKTANPFFRRFQACAAYGADVPQSAMKPDQDCWNFGSANFPCLTKIFTTKRTPGVYTPYLYVGSWGSAFGLHPEDKDLYSLNYLHEGDSKFWYGMPATHSASIEDFAKEILPKEAKLCDQFLRHKSLLIEPSHFIQRGIPVYAAEQKHGDLMITFPNAYHYGFNSGFNVAESRNIATADWLDWGLKAKHCTCAMYGAPDVLPHSRIVKMAILTNPKKYDFLKKNAEIRRPIKRVRRI